MKVYINAASRHSDISQYIGKDDWVKVRCVFDRGFCEWYIRPLRLDEYKLTFNHCGTDIDWTHHSWDESTVAQVLKDKITVNIYRIQVLQPVEVLTTKELISCLYSGECCSEDDFHIRKIPY